MQAFKSILVDVDATASAQPALERAARLARGTGATITIVDVMMGPGTTQDHMPAGVHEAMVAEQREQLERLAGGLTDLRVETKLLAGRPATVLIQEVLRSHHDLLMRSHARDLSGPNPKLFGVVDMELLRKCPCPVLLVRHGDPVPRPQIVAAVNASTHDPEEHALNVRIIELTLALADLLEAQGTSVVHVWAPLAETKVRSHSTPDQFAAYVESGREKAEADLARLVQSHESTQGKLQPVLLRGDPEDAIPQFVVAEGVDMVVMGTLARTGIAGMLIGNTAERVLGKLPCSVLTVKPEGFVSPVQLDDA